MPEPPADADTPPARRRRARTPFVGPLFAWEIVRLARRGQDARARTILAAVLMLTLFGFTLIWFPDTGLRELFFGGQQEVSIEESSRFAEQFSLTLLLAALVMVLITPAYAAGGIADEKERRTYGYLLASSLSNREIVLGKFLGRVVFLLGVMGAGLPVLAITGLVGGIDPLFLLLAYALTGNTVIVIAAASVACAVYAPTFRGAMFRSYGLAAIYACFGCLYPLFSPFAVLVILFYGRTGEVGFYLFSCGIYFAGQWATALGALWLAVRRVRLKKRRPPPAPKRRPQPPPGVPVATPIEPKRRRDDDRERRRGHDYDHFPEVQNRPKVFADDPFFWKERYTLGSRRTADEESIRGTVTLVGTVFAAMLGFAGLIAFLSLILDSSGRSEATAKMLILFGSAAGFASLLTLGSAAVQCVLRERQHGTLESLLTIPVPRRNILWPKWRVCAGRGWWWGGPGMVAVVLGLAVSRVGYAAVPATVFLPGVAAFAVSFGIWLSIVGRTLSKAVIAFLGAVGGFLLVPIVLWWVFDERDGKLLPAVVMGLFAALSVGLAVSFWRKACRAFDADGRE